MSYYSKADGFGRNKLIRFVKLCNKKRKSSGAVTSKFAKKLI